MELLKPTNSVEGFQLNKMVILKQLWMPQKSKICSLCIWTAKEEISISELWVSTKCGENDTTAALGSCPTVGNMFDKLLPENLWLFGETSEITEQSICKKKLLMKKLVINE